MANLLPARYKVGAMVEHRTKHEIDSRYGIVTRSEMSNGKEEYIEAVWFSDPFGDCPYTAIVSTKKIRIISDG
jgi:hypothetical protein